MLLVNTSYLTVIILSSTSLHPVTKKKRTHMQSMTGALAAGKERPAKRAVGYLNKVKNTLAAYWPFMMYTASVGCKPSGQMV
jgi:hypothetical protein